MYLGNISLLARPAFSRYLKAGWEEGGGEI